MVGTADTTIAGDRGRGGTGTTGTETGETTEAIGTETGEPTAAIGTELKCKACYLEFVEPRELETGELVRCPRCDGYVRDVPF